MGTKFEESKEVDKLKHIGGNWWNFSSSSNNLSNKNSGTTEESNWQTFSVL
ncbi:28004_t:CDS:2 [Dentiscutata erythropus]|uniref:28004_t:CDS:1 n=1 Tax=Dentiscutata erythropus TaxID=1348616 RepID=A0A9N9E0Y1_9GLOM|nr:28004_t:CDS:2 [Dentiscutata erythropus]